MPPQHLQKILAWCVRSGWSHAGHLSAATLDSKAAHQTHHCIRSFLLSSAACRHFARHAAPMKLLYVVTSFAFFLLLSAGRPPPGAT